MIRPMHLPERQRRAIRRSLLLCAMVLVALTAVAPETSAQTVRRVWRASIGTAGVNGSATITAFTDGTGWLHVSGRNLHPGTPYAIRIFRGQCSGLGTLLLYLGSETSSSTGRIDRYTALIPTRMNAIWSATGSGGAIALWIGSGSLARCGNLGFPVVTRVVISALRTDLPVVRQSSGFPYCNVAMYMTALSQPGEPGVTMLYAHARTGMFLPLLLRSQIQNGASLIGMYVRVYTSNQKLYLYRISAVRRHVTSVSSAFGTWTPQLWLQTSEGYYSTSRKLVVVARLIHVYSATYAASHPRAHPIVCH